VSLIRSNLRAEVISSLISSTKVVVNHPGEAAVNFQQDHVQRMRHEVLDAHRVPTGQDENEQLARGNIAETTVSPICIQGCTALNWY
jgi:hypothetical protein